MSYFRPVALVLSAAKLGWEDESDTHLALWEGGARRGGRWPQKSSRSGRRDGLGQGRGGRSKASAEGQACLAGHFAGLTRRYAVLHAYTFPGARGGKCISYFKDLRYVLPAGRGRLSWVLDLRVYKALIV
jgi:hypothetical protein